MKRIEKSAGILIQKRKILLAKSFGKDMYISPGGKKQLGETSEQTLVRELQEEFQIKVEEKDLEYFALYETPAAGEEDIVVSITVYFVHQWAGAIIPNNEIEAILWSNSTIPENIQVGSIFAHEILPSLKALNLID